MRQGANEEKVGYRGPLRPAGFLRLTYIKGVSAASNTFDRSKLAPGHMGPICERFSVRNAPFSGVILCNSGASSSKEYSMGMGRSA
jgi:hypothetical protein